MGVCCASSGENAAALFMIAATMSHSTSTFTTELIPEAQTTFAFRLYLILSDPKDQHVSCSSGHVYVVYQPPNLCSHCRSLTIANTYYTLQQIISWMPHGRAWKIHNRELLMTEVVPKYFTMKKYQSFQRQINGWGFQLLNQAGNDKGAYYHEYFLRGMPHLLVLIQRMPVPKEKVKVLKYESPTDKEPTFFEKIDKLTLTLPSCPNKSDQDSLPEDLNITPLSYDDRPKLALHHNTNQPASRRYNPSTITMTGIHHLPNQHPQLAHPLQQHQTNDWMCYVENDSDQQSTIRHVSVSEGSDTVNNYTKRKVDAVLHACMERLYKDDTVVQAFMERSFDRLDDNTQDEPAANGSEYGAHQYWNNDHASSMNPSSLHDAAAEKNEEEIVAHYVVHQHEEECCNVSPESQDKPNEVCWLCKPCMDTNTQFV